MSTEALILEAPAPVWAEPVLRYIDPACDGGILYEQARDASTLVFDPRRVKVLDARRASPAPRLDSHGFELVDHPFEIDLDEVKAAGLDPSATAYAREVERLVKAMTGASEVVVFNQVIRDEAAPDANKPAHSVHLDFDRATLEGFVRAARPDAERLLAGRFANINLWRGLAPVERTPLAICQGSTIAEEDLRVGHIRMTPQTPSPPMSGFNIAWSPAHRWWVYPKMQPDEVLVFRLYDSDPRRTQLTAHTAFEDPGAAAGAPPRRSLEVRILAFFEDR